MKHKMFKLCYFVPKKNYDNGIDNKNVIYAIFYLLKISL